MFAKKIITFVALLIVPMVAFSGPNNTPQPNSYEFSANNLHISYTTSGFDGRSHFTYQDAKRTLNFTGNQVRTVGTEIGTLVTVTTSMTVDTGSTSFSVLVPNVNLDQTLEAPLKAKGIITQHKFSVIPSFNSGQKDNYKMITLTGTAKFVVF